MAISAELERRKMVRLRARPDLNITPQKYEGKTCYVVKDPVSLKYYRFNDQEYFVVSHFDGKHTLEDTQKDFEKNFRPHRLTLEDLEAFSQQLLTAGLVQHETPQAGKELYTKRRKQQRMQKLAAWTNILYIKLPIFDPDKILRRMLMYLRWVFTWTFFACTVGLMISAVALVITHFQTFYDKLPNYHEFFRWNTLLYMWIALGIVKVIHEFGHGLSCKAYGGECHEMGALFLCLSPCLYCNVSDSWTIPSKWKRIAISFAGIYVELCIAALATWIWWYTPGRPVVNNIALCVMVLCSVSTVVFNANPLMRFDGYYMMADWLEIPNLRDRSNKLLQNLFYEHCLGIEVQPEAYMETRRKALFVVYAVISYVYRWVVTFGILYFLSNWLKPYNLAALSGLLAIAALGSMVGWPVYRMAKNYFRRGRMPDMKRTRVTATSTVILTILALFFFLPLPISRIRQTGLMQLTREATAHGKVTVPNEALLDEIYVQNGERVYEKALLARLRNPKLESERSEAEAQRHVFLTEADSTGREMLTAQDPDEKKQIDAKRISAIDMAKQYAEKSNSLRAQIDALRELRAPCNGVVMAAPKKEDVGKLWEKEHSTPFCIVGDSSQLQIIIPVGPDDFRLLQDEVNSKIDKWLPVTIMVPGRGTNYLTGKIRRLPETNAKEVPIQLTHRGGGPLAVKPANDPKVIEPQSQQYLIEVDLDQVDSYLMPGTLVLTKTHCKWRSCAWFCWRKLSSMFDLGLI
ncbi:MAG: site-2 protease family protein [Gemmataceae bacterium]